MLIGIDGNEANQKIRVGSGVYAFELLKQFKKYQISNIKYQIYLKDTLMVDLPRESAKWKYIITGPKSLWTQLGLPIKLWREKMLGKAPDVFFTPTHYAPRFCPIPSVITIFDLSFLKFPEMFLPKDLYQLKNWTTYSVKQAKKIITISEFSKKEIVDYYHIPQEDVVVVYPGYDEKRFNPHIKNQKSKIKNTNKKLNIDGEYILYIGTVQPRKNLVRLIEAFSTLKTANYEPITKNLKLVICGMINEGRGGWMQEEIIEKIKNNVIITGYVPDDDLPYLMAGAKAFVLPSLYEGFGIPVVEAMACGVPTVVSNVSSLPEISGDAAILVDPYDIENIANGIKEACYNNVKREEVIKKGLLQVKKINWEKSAKIVLDALIDI